MALLEKEVIRFAESLDDYEHVTVTDIGGYGPIGYWLVVHDHRFDLDYQIASHCDYWDFVSAFVSAVPAPHSGGKADFATRGRSVSGERTVGAV